MLIKFKYQEVVQETEFALNIFIDDFDFWIPKSIILKKDAETIYTYKWWVRDKRIEYDIAGYKDVLDSNLKPLTELINEKSSNFFPEKAMKHQEECFKWAINKKCVALFNEMGTGKSKLYIDIANYHYSCQNIDKVLYFAPPTTLNNFKNEIQLWQKSSLKWIIKSVHELSLKTANDLIDNYNINEKTMIIIDESHRIKNIDSKMSSTAMILGNKTDFKIIGTGTSAPNNAIDLIGQFRFLTPQYYNMPKNQFKKTYLTIGNKGIITGIKDPLKILQQTTPYTYSIKKAECLDLPEKIFYPRYINDEKLKTFIKEVNKVNIESFMGGDSSLMGFLQNLRKIATGRDLENQIIIKNPKIQALKDILEDIPKNEKIIIWHNLYIELEDILEVIKDDFVLLNGSCGDKEKANAITKFKKGETRFLISTQATGGVGLNFTEANINIFFSNSFNLIDRLQSESRSHRIGQLKQLLIYDLINAGTIDNRIIDSLNRKEDFMNEIQDIYKNKTKKEVIDVILGDK